VTAQIEAAGKRLQDRVQAEGAALREQLDSSWLEQKDKLIGGRNQLQETNADVVSLRERLKAAVVPIAAAPMPAGWLDNAEEEGTEAGQSADGSRTGSRADSVAGKKKKKLEEVEKEDPTAEEQERLRHAAVKRWEKQGHKVRAIGLTHKVEIGANYDDGPPFPCLPPPPILLLADQPRGPGRKGFARDLNGQDTQDSAEVRAAAAATPCRART
jgi:hypothetical protein